MAALSVPAPSSPHARLLGVGAYRPERVVPNSELVEAIDSSDEWIQQRSGIVSRRFAGPEETVRTMSVAASAQALEAAGVEAEQIDRSEEHTSELQSLMRNSYAVFCL